MTTSSINTNTAAVAAQANLKLASASTLRSVSVLSSGNRIINLSEDAAGSAIGNKLATDVNTFRTVLGSLNQGKSVLDVADGALRNILTILQRQKALAVQSNSGTVSDSERAFLDQEFQSLKTQISNIRDNTKFGSNLNLLNGSIAGSINAVSNTDAGGAANTAVTLYTVSNILPTDGQTITIGGATITFSTDVTRLDRARVGASETATAANLAAFLNASTDSRITPFTYTNSNGVLQTRFAGGVVTTSSSNNTIVSAAGTYSSGTATTATPGANGTAGLSAGRTVAVGTIEDNLLTALQLSGQDFSTIRGNPSFVGTISGFQVTYTGSNAIAISLRVGQATYVGTIANTSAASTVSLTGTHDDGSTNVGSFTLSYAAQAVAQQSGHATGSDAETYARRLDAAFAGLSFYQNRDVESYVAGGAIVTGGVVTGNLSGTSVDFRSNSFSKFEVSSVKVSAPAAGSSDSTIELVINGETYRSRAGVGTQLAADSYTILTNVNDPNKFVGFLNGGTAQQIESADKAASFEAALSEAFGLNGTTKGLTFQVGLSAAEVIDVKIKDVSTLALGIDDLSIATAAGATAASSALDAAINTATSIRSDVGAAQSRFGFASAAVSSAIQNVDSARGIILDADVAQEASDFASNQVRLQAAISVLAQANQLQQNLLKLIA